MSPRAERAPAFQFYPKDWDSDENVIPMTLEEEGVYWQLCRRYWLADSLPADLDRLRVFVKGRPSLEQMQAWWVAIGPCFGVRGDRLTHKRLDRERQKQAKNRKVRKLAADKRWAEKHANAMHMHSQKDANAMHEQCLSSSSSTASSTSTPVVKSVEPRALGAGGGSYLAQSRIAFNHRGHTLNRGPHYDAFVERFDGDAEQFTAWLTGEIDAAYERGERPGNLFKFIDERWEVRKPKPPARALMGAPTEPLPKIWYVECDEMHETRCANGKAHYDKRDAERAKEIA